MDTNKEMTFDDLLELAQQIRDYTSEQYEAKGLYMKHALLITAVVSASLVEGLADQMKTITLDEVREDYLQLFNAYFGKGTNHNSIVIEKDGRKHRLCKDKGDNMPDSCKNCSLLEQCAASSRIPLCCEVAEQFHLSGFYHFEIKK